MTTNPILPDSIMQTAMGFWVSKTLLSAVELGVFTELAKGPQDCESLRKSLGLHPRSARDFFDALVALRMLDRRDGRYANTPETDMYLDRAKTSYIGGMLEMANKRLYKFWGGLTEGLQTGQPQNEAKHGSVDLFDAIYGDQAAVEHFAKAMTGLSILNARAIAAAFPWHEYKSFADVGGAQGGFTVEVARAHTHLTGVNFDLPAVGPVFEDYIREHGMSDRLSFHPGSFFTDPLPRADVLVMGHILHDWDMEQKRMLLRKAYDALPEGGALIVYDGLIDDERKESVFGLLMSLNMLIETLGGFDYTGADCIGWMQEAGFRDCRVERITPTHGMVVGFK